MISDQDIEKLKGVFATKDDLKGFATKEDLADLKLEVGELHDQVSGIEEKLDSVESKIDGLTGLIHASLEEHAAGAVAIARHTRQIRALAHHTNAVLPD